MRIAHLLTTSHRRGPTSPSPNRADAGGCKSGSQETRRWREMDSNHRSLSRASRFILPKVNCAGIDGAAKKTGGGTDGSNPSPSSGESSANLTQTTPERSSSALRYAVPVGRNTWQPSLTLKPPSAVRFHCYFADNQALPLNRRTKTTISSSRPTETIRSPCRATSRGCRHRAGGDDHGGGEH
jgi:hypothetical protein